MKDTVDKIVRSYFASVTKEAFTYKGEEYLPRPLRVSPLLLRGYKCPAGCGACCQKFTLDYLPGDEAPPGCHERLVQFSGRSVRLFTDGQPGNSTRFCRHLRPEDGRCGIHGIHPFSCDFELVRFLTSESPDRPNSVLTKLYGRGWNMLRVVDQERGAMCTIVSPTPSSIADAVRKLKRLREWTDHFGLKETWIPEVVDLIERGRLVDDVVFDPYAKPKGFGFTRS